MGKQRLELTWIGKNTRPKLEPRILIEDPEKSYGVSETDNMLIHGDNLLALKALEQEYAGHIKCVFIDPPYNTGSAFAHYDDGLEHSVWLNLMRDRLILLRNLLSNEGSIWISIDDDESHYLKILCDEVFGRSNFIANVIWQKKFSPQNDAKWLSDMHDHILVFAKDKLNWYPNRIPIDSKTSKTRKNIDNDPRGSWISVDYTCNKNKDERPNLYYPITNPNTGEEIWPKETAVWRYNQERHQENVLNDLVYWGKNGTNSVPRFKNFKSISMKGQIPTTVWLHQDVGNNQEARKESLVFNDKDPFSTPKPERLIERVLQIASNPGDLVLDSFLGSGTTSAVAHKMERKWIGIELGEHCLTHCKPRMDMVVSGEDQGGISKSVVWKGGGGYKFYSLAPSLLNKDNYGNWVINQEYNADMLAAAMAKQEGFRYSPDSDIYWKQGQSTEQDFIFTTTEFLTQEHVEYIHSQMKEGESLLICCKAFNANDSHFPNITIKKIPKMLMGKCEFGKDDYSLNIINIPIDDNEENFPDSVTEPKPKYVAGQAELFDLEGDNE
ncbi:site-specific DNA-methyltransferase [Spirochaeta cellobiosiphila]|uniref:site-specific DNA-methyltransferase n=1 Tax=Spirochaeta cellobiosiphila TaxID=504483 RepID=UPI000412A049|nr:site-specific DNA-methyltransferase [Spirochaeta cellobiosiphila]